MANLHRAIFIHGGLISQLDATDTLQLNNIDTAAAGALVIGNAVATSVGIASAGSACTTVDVGTAASVTALSLGGAGLATLALGTGMGSGDIINVGGATPGTPSGATINLNADVNIAGVLTEIGTSAFTDAVLFKGPVTYGYAEVVTIAAASNLEVLPQATIHASSVAGFAAGGGTIYVTTSTGEQTVTYTGVSGNDFTGCTGGTGTMLTGGRIGSEAIGTDTITYASGTRVVSSMLWSSATGGTIGAADQRAVGTGAAFTVKAGGALGDASVGGTLTLTGGVGGASTGANEGGVGGLVVLQGGVGGVGSETSSPLDASMVGDSLSPDITVLSTTGFGDSGYLNVPITPSGTTQVTYSSKTGTTFQGCGYVAVATIDGSAAISQAIFGPASAITAPSIGDTVPGTAGGAGVGIIAVTSSTGFASAGSIDVPTAGGPVTIAYTGKTATTFTGCTGGSSEVMAAGNITQSATSTTNMANTSTAISIVVDSTAAFPNNGTASVPISPSGTATFTFTSKHGDGVTFLGCFGAVGTMAAGNVIALSDPAPGVGGSIQIKGGAAGAAGTGVGHANGGSILLQAGAATSALSADGDVTIDPLTSGKIVCGSQPGNYAIYMGDIDTQNPGIRWDDGTNKWQVRDNAGGGWSNITTASSSASVEVGTAQYQHLYWDTGTSTWKHDNGDIMLNGAAARTIAVDVPGSAGAGNGLNLNASDAVTSGVGGNVTITAGRSRQENIGGSVILTGGMPANSSGNPGSIYLRPGYRPSNGMPSLGGQVFFGSTDDGAPYLLAEQDGGVHVAKIGAGSNGQALPFATIYANTTLGFPSVGTILVTTGAGVQIVSYTSITGGGTPSFNGCTNGTGVMSTGGNILSNTGVGFHVADGTGTMQFRNRAGVWANIGAASPGGALPASTLYGQVLRGNGVGGWTAETDISLDGTSGSRTISVGPISGTGAGNNLTILAADGHVSGGGGSVIINAGQMVSTGVNGNVTIGGTAIGNRATLVNLGNRTDVSEFGAIAIPATGAVTFTEDLTFRAFHLGGANHTIMVGQPTSAGSFGDTLRIYGGLAPASTDTTLHSSMNTLTLPQATIYVASITGFATAGKIAVTTSLGKQQVEYTGVAAGSPPSFTGCTGGSGVLSTGGAVSSAIAGGSVNIDGGAKDADGMAHGNVMIGTSIGSGDAQTELVAIGTGGAMGVFNTSTSGYYPRPAVVLAFNGMYFDDAGAGGNTQLVMGKSTDTKFALYANKGTGTAQAGIRYNDSTVKWEIQTTGATWSPITAGSGVLPTSVIDYQVLQNLSGAATWRSDITLPNTANRTISVELAPTATPGRLLTITAGAALDTNNVGGNVTVQGGAGVGSGAGGDARLFGAVAVGTGVAGIGYVKGGDCASGAAAGNVLIFGGDNSSTGVGGDVKITAGTSTSGTAGSTRIYGKVAFVSATGTTAAINFNPGTQDTPLSTVTSDIMFASGHDRTIAMANSASYGYTLNIQASNTTGASTSGGPLVLNAGTATGATSNGGWLYLNGGAATDGLGGRIQIAAGEATVGTGGWVTIDAGAGSVDAGDIYLARTNGKVVWFGGGTDGVSFTRQTGVFTAIGSGFINLDTVGTSRLKFNGTTVTANAGITAGNFLKLFDGSADVTSHTHGGGAATQAIVNTTCGEIVSKGMVVGIKASTGAKTFKTVTNGAGATPHFVLGLANSTTSAGGDPLVVITSGEVSIAAGEEAAAWDSAPSAGDVGKLVWALDGTAGKITLTPPTTTGYYKTKVGILTFAGSGSKVAVQIGDPMLL